MNGFEGPVPNTTMSCLIEEKNDTRIISNLPKSSQSTYFHYYPINEETMFKSEDLMEISDQIWP